MKLMRVSSEHIITFLIFLPSIILVGYFVHGLIAWNIFVSFTDWRGLTPQFNLVGLKQYEKLLSDEVFSTSFTNNILLIILFIPGSMVLGLLLAILLDIIGGRAEGIFRAIYLLPFSLSFVVTAAMWAWMYNFSHGVINSLLDMLGLSFLKMNWIGDPKIAIHCIIVALIWQFSGYTMLIFLAGIKSIPESHVMAAKIDGASNFKLYTRIVIPQLKYWAFAAFVVLTVFALKAFDFIYVLTNGGPGISTYVLGLMMFRRAFFETDFSYGASIATVLFVLTMLVVIPYLIVSLRMRSR
jgi:glucose/mannose transport system permease protein